MARQKPISTEIDETVEPKLLFKLFEEVRELLSNHLGKSKRGMGDRDKALYKARLNLYSMLYKKARAKFLKYGKETVTTPIPDFDKFMRDYVYKKTITYSSSIDEEDDTINLDSIVKEEAPDDNFEIENTDDDMAKKLFFRNDPEVIADVKSLSLEDFVQKYSDTTASPDTLEKAYSELKSRDTKKVIQERVGKETTDTPLDAKSPVSGSTLEPVVPDPDAGIAGNKENLERISETVEEAIAAAAIIPEPATGELIDKQADTTPGAKPFKEMDKDLKLQIVQEYYDQGYRKPGDIKSKMLQDKYIINHYDDVYNVFLKIKKK